MAKFCGGFKFDTTSLKLIKGILCLADAQDVDPSKAVTGCGQMWVWHLCSVIGTSKSSNLLVYSLILIAGFIVAVIDSVMSFPICSLFFLLILEAK